MEGTHSKSTPPWKINRVMTSCTFSHSLSSGAATDLDCLGHEGANLVKICFDRSPREVQGPLDGVADDGADCANDRLLSFCLRFATYGDMVVTDQRVSRLHQSGTKLLKIYS